MEKKSKEMTHHDLLTKFKEKGFVVKYGVEYKLGPYTFAKAEAIVQPEETNNISDGTTATTKSLTLTIPSKMITGFGLSRRSNQDKPNEIQGNFIAEGRALKALLLKVEGIKDLHRRHLLMA